jgi:hypothetical protein
MDGGVNVYTSWWVPTIGRYSTSKLSEVDNTGLVAEVTLDNTGLQARG